MACRPDISTCIPTSFLGSATVFCNCELSCFVPDKHIRCHKLVITGKIRLNFSCNTRDTVKLLTPSPCQTMAMIFAQGVQPRCGKVLQSSASNSPTSCTEWAFRKLFYSEQIFCNMMTIINVAKWRDKCLVSTGMHNPDKCTEKVIYYCMHNKRTDTSNTEHTGNKQHQHSALTLV